MNSCLLSAVVEGDETYIGDKERNKHADKRIEQGRGTIGKTAVIGAKERGGWVSAQVIKKAYTSTLHTFVNENVAKGSQVFADEHSGYVGMQGAQHKAVKHKC